MDSFHTDNDTTFWPYGGDQTTAWSEVAGNEQAALTLDWAASGPIMTQNPDRVFAGTFDELFDVNVGLGPLNDLEAAGAGIFNPDRGYASNFLDCHYTNTDSVAPWLMPTPPLTDSDTIASPPGDASWNGHAIMPAQLMEEPQSGLFACGPAAAAPFSPNELAWLFEQPDQFPRLVPSYTDGDGGRAGPYPPDFNFAGTVGTTPWGLTQTGAPPLGTISPAESMPASTRTILRKRPRGEEETSGELHNNSIRSAHKRIKKMTTNGVLEAAGSTSRARHKSATRTQLEIDGISEAAGRGAGRLAAPNAHEVYHPFLPGPRVQKELVGTNAQGELPWIEGSAEEATWSHTSSVVRQQEVVNSAEDGEREVVERRKFRIPRRLSQRQLDLLEATPDDLARGTVRELKCRLCPGAAFGNWEDYRRHCNLSEAHPVELSYCEFCGDFFARPDSLTRHRKNRPAVCLGVTPDEALAKRGVAEQVHRVFEESLERYLETNEEIGELFAQRIKPLLSKSSKRGSRQQCRLKGSRA